MLTKLLALKQLFFLVQIIIVINIFEYRWKVQSDFMVMTSFVTSCGNRNPVHHFSFITTPPPPFIIPSYLHPTNLHTLLAYTYVYTRNYVYSVCTILGKNKSNHGPTRYDRAIIPAARAVTSRRGGQWARERPTRPSGAVSWITACRRVTRNVFTVITAPQSIKTFRVKLKPPPGPTSTACRKYYYKTYVNTHHTLHTPLKSFSTPSSQRPLCSLPKLFVCKCRL